MKLAVGISDFRKIIEDDYYYVDKSLLIKDVLDDTEVVLITRPRRFGKTLNLSMLKHFFAREVLKQPTHDLFKNLEISKAGNEYLKHQEKYPVIFISFKDIKARDYRSAYHAISKLISDLYTEHQYLLESESLYVHEKAIYQSILNQQATEINLRQALKDLTHYVHRHFKEKAITLIDEYDTPIQEAYIHNYYDEMINFSRNFLGASLKDNPYIFKAVITGILRVSKESLFSGLNNIKVYSLLSSRYSGYFGFTEEEVLALLQKACMQEKLNEVKNWYNGYQIANTVLYNPWSIINCISEEGRLRPYWVNTSDNALIKKMLMKSSTRFKTEFEYLMQNQTIERIVDEHLAFNYLNNNDHTAAWSLLFAAGYLKVVSYESRAQGLWCHLKIPNQEIRNLYQTLIEQWLSDGYGIEWYYEFLDDLLNGRVAAFERHLQVIYQQIISVHDVARFPEAFYHGLILGLVASLNRKDYEVRSNRESGYGRYDLAIIPADPQKLVILMEFKVAEENTLQQTAELALQQIDEKQYAAEFSTRGLNKILKIGISFCGKKIAVVSK